MSYVFIIGLISSIVLCIVGVIKLGKYIFPKKEDRKNSKQKKDFEDKRKDLVDLDRNAKKKDYNAKEKILIEENQFENNKNIEKTQKEINEEILKRLERVEGENKAIKEENKTIREENETIREENKTIREENKTIREENKTIREELNLTDLNSIIQKQEINLLTIKNNMFLNAYKILYYRKIANIILEVIFTKNAKKFYRTEYIFRHGEGDKPGYKNKSFPIIIAKRNIEHLSANIINLLIDYLMYIKDFTSSFIHIVKKFPIQIEILFSIFGNVNITKDENNNYFIDSSILINTIFGEDIQLKKNEVTEKEDDIKNEKENIEEPKKNLNNINEIYEDDNSKDKIGKEKIEANLKEGTIEGKNNNAKANTNGNNSNSSENTNTRNEEREIEENLNIINNNNTIIINEKQIEKKNLINGINNFINIMKENEQNFTINDIIEQINNLNIEKVLENVNDFNKNELLKINNIRILRDKLVKNKDATDNTNIIDIKYIFQEWKKSFEESYKAQDNFKKLVKYDEKIELKDIKNVASYLLQLSKIKEITLFGDDPGDFKNISFDTLKQAQFENYKQ